LVKERFEQNVPELPGTPDLVFKRSKVVVFINGCFWHSHVCRTNARTIGSNRLQWAAKLSNTLARDFKARSLLGADGWSTITLWECDLRVDPIAQLMRVRELVKDQVPKQ
jgi:DNA mismatch endonuclease (patch repair protein)